MASIHIPKDIAKELVCDLSGDFTLEGEEYKLKCVHFEIQEVSRWSVHYFKVFKDLNTGKCYGVNYSEGATELQDESPFEYDGDVIEFNEYEPYEKMVTSYNLVED